jgi:mitochondrial import receptor subunit TOM20
MSTGVEVWLKCCGKLPKLAPAHAIKEAWTESTFFIDFIATSTSCLCLTTLRASSVCPWINVLYLGLYLKRSVVGKMASTTPSQSVSFTTIALASTGLILTGTLAYALYFDHRRRTDPDFRKNLKRQHKKISRESQEASKAAERSQKERIKRSVDQANEDGFPTDPEETESYFMQEVARGETMCQDGSDPVEAALCFYRALKVYPQPRELITIYDKTVPKVCYWTLCEIRLN